MSQVDGLVEHVRQIVTYLLQGGSLTDELVEYLEGAQDALATLHEKYDLSALEGAEVMSELLTEALRLIHDGVEEILVAHDEGVEREHLTTVLSAIEEGNDVLASVIHAIENDTSWASGAALG